MQATGAKKGKTGLLYFLKRNKKKQEVNVQMSLQIINV